MLTPGLSSTYGTDEIILKRFGLTQEQLARAKSLRQLGVTEDDLVIAAKIILEMPRRPEKRNSQPGSTTADKRGSTKSELLMGYDSASLNREKALKRLGASEEDVEIENSKVLGGLGQSGRRRSFLDIFGNGIEDSDQSGKFVGQRRIARSASAPPSQLGKWRRSSWFAREKGIATITQNQSRPSGSNSRRSSLINILKSMAGTADTSSNNNDSNGGSDASPSWFCGSRPSNSNSSNGGGVNGVISPGDGVKNLTRNELELLVVSMKAREDERTKELERMAEKIKELERQKE